jgi:uncharacterized protein (DUF885 family)
MDAFTLSDQLTTEFCSLRPATATLMGVPGRDDAWDDFGPAGAAAVADLARRTSSQLAALDAPSSAEQRLAAGVLADWAELELERFDCGDHWVDLNSIASSFQVMRMVFDVMDTAAPIGAEAAVRRLLHFSRPLASYRALLAEGRGRSAVAAVRQVRAVLRQGRNIAAADGYLASLGPKLSAGLGSEARAHQAISTAQRAMSEFCNWLEAEYLPAAHSEDGVGRERYLRSAKRFLGMELDIDETYAWGMSEVERLLADMDTLTRRHSSAGSASAWMAELRADPARCAPSTEAFLAAMQARQEQALADLMGRHFDVPEPVRRLDVRRAPNTGAVGAYYMPPSEDFSRPGCVWYAFAGEGPVPLYDEISTAYHEGFPGHHLQIGLSIWLTEKLSRWQRVSEGYSGYAEGWALYAEHLMGELGYYERPEYTLGMLANQLIRALRVLIDIGLHTGLPIPMRSPFEPGRVWTHERAVEALTSFGGLSREHAESEATRYCGWPGQAISYLVGQRVILELRGEYMQWEGAELRTFHRRVLSCGSVGLDRLRTVLRNSDLQAGPAQAPVAI